MVSEKREKTKNSMIAKHCSINGIDFDSLAECGFYMRLCRIFGENNVKRGEKIVIISASDNSPGLSWMPDFNVMYQGVRFVVEFKGTLKPGTHGRDIFLLKWSALHSSLFFEFLPKYIVFTAGNESCKWNTTEGKKEIPSLFSAKLMSDDDILAQFKIRHCLLS